MIKNNYDDNKKHIHVLSYGGGTQSTALLLLALEGKVGGVIPDYIIYSDTGWEPEYINDWILKVNNFIKERYDREIIFTNNGNIREDIIKATQKGSRVANIPFFVKNEEGKKAMLLRQCTAEYKIIPVKKKVRELLGYKPRMRVKEIVHMWKGISTDEIQRVKPIPDKWIEAEHPLVDILEMDRNDCIKYVESFGIGTPRKSSCIGCPFRGKKDWLEMKKNDPKSFEDACEVDDSLRNWKKFKDPVFLHRDCIPLREIKEEDKQLSIYDEDDLTNECEGFCGL